MKIGFVSLPISGHLNPMAALGRRLQSHGHDVSLIGVPDVEPYARAAGLRFIPFGEKEYPLSSGAKLYAPMSKLHGLEVPKWSVRETSVKLFQLASEQLPSKLKAAGVEGLAIDTIYLFVEVVPMSLGIPYVHLWNALHNDLTGVIPPSFFSWPRRRPRKLLRGMPMELRRY